jgi:hypothetical protein
MEVEQRIFIEFRMKEGFDAQAILAKLQAHFDEIA